MCFRLGLLCPVFIHKNQRTSLCASSFQHSFPLAMLLKSWPGAVAYPWKYVSLKICIKAEANLEFISGVKICVWIFLLTEMCCHCWVEPWVQALLVTSRNVVAALVPFISSLVPAMKLYVHLLPVCWRPQGMGPVVVARSWVLLLFPALLATILLLWGEVAPFTECFTGGAGQVSHHEP